MHKSATLPSATIGWKAAAGPMLTLMPGQLHFGKNIILKTLLGSCVALTLWHPHKHIGGMCHYLLPCRTRRPGEPLDGRFGDEAVETLVNALERAGTQSKDYIVHLYGGADTMPDGMNLKFNVGERNIEQAWQLIDKHGFQLDGVDVGDYVPRSVSLELPSGLVQIKRGGTPPAGVKKP
ncbi:chemotaxis protein CheD [Paucibacter sp. APW11]|uniref:Probable chemoreceptor glutamine deamidase CheD n=1 Tax=Roseateles aquae TaxID=3077235 RepID=A0ABU3PGI4_9BURK|nr:chemotaxis protein CheD [Paucibacter sp. APW11]MDT9001716.1 chemotaxis protein CheD [Paucibacter sp. APW11]